MLWLDHLIFGNGHGLATPYWDGRFYWLSGQLYTWVGGFGAQLQSLEWRHPLPGEERRLGGRAFRPFNSRRQFLRILGIPTPISRVMVTWATRLPDDLDEANGFLWQFKRTLGENF